MGRILSIDFGRKRCGIAVTDISRIVASGLTTVATANLEAFVLDYISRENVDLIVVGEPRDLRGLPSESQKWLRPAIEKLQKRLPPGIPLIFYDERFTSVLAHQAMIIGGLSKKARQDKALVDEVSATILLNDFLQSKLYSEL